jgi:hypothetical protein
VSRQLARDSSNRVRPSYSGHSVPHLRTLAEAVRLGRGLLLGYRRDSGTANANLIVVPSRLGDPSIVSLTAS